MFQLDSKCWNDFDLHVFSHLTKKKIFPSSNYRIHLKLHRWRFLILEVPSCQSCSHDKNIRSIRSLGSHKSEFHLFQVSVGQADRVWPLVFQDANSQEEKEKNISLHFHPERTAFTQSFSLVKVGLPSTTYLHSCNHCVEILERPRRLVSTHPCTCESASAADRDWWWTWWYLTCYPKTPHSH